MDAIERLTCEAFDSGSVTQVIRPAARLDERAARVVLVELALSDVRSGGLWDATPSLWQRYDAPWARHDDPTSARLVGGIQVAYGTPTRYEITIYRVTVTAEGASAGWTVEALCNQALGFAGLTLANCPRVVMTPPPKRFELH